MGIYDGFTVDITADDLICLGDEVLLSAIDVTGGEGNGYSFDFAYDGVTFAAGEEDEVGFVPPLTGEFCVTVSEACTTPPVTACMEVEVEQPYDLTLAADTTRGCVPEAIPFSHSIPSAFVQSQGWDFGDGGQSVEATPVHIFDEPGVYDIALSVITTTGCVNTTIADDYIQVYTPPSVGFDAGPQPTTAPDTRIDFESSVSPNVVEWNWTFIPRCGRRSEQRAESDLHLPDGPGRHLPGHARGGGHQWMRKPGDPQRGDLRFLQRFHPECLHAEQ